MPARLTFFLELDAPALTALLATPGVLDDLQRAGAGLSMAMLDLDPLRAVALRELARRGIPVTAWLVLDPADGYWLTVDNASLAARRYAEVRDWSQRENLSWRGVGLDIEIPEPDAVALTARPVRTLWRLARNRRSRAVVHAALTQYQALIARIRGDGLPVETYQFPLVVDERRVGSTLMQRVFGFADVRGDREVLMLYRSVLPAPWGRLLVDAYGADAEGIAVGITGGGVAALQPAFEARLLDFTALREDLGRARRLGKPLYVFSLEGCVAAGYLARLCQEAVQPLAAVTAHPASRAGRALLRMVLRIDPLWRRLRRRPV